MKNEFQLTLPHGAEQRTIIASQNIIIVGANGAGKTRLGTWLEMHSPQKSKVHRISAQKSLSMPEFSSTMSYQKAQSRLLYGYQDANESNGASYKQGHKWASRPATYLLSDFEQLMVYLFSEDYEQSTQYRQAALSTENRLEPPNTKIDIVKRIWEEILPHRELTIGGGAVKTSIKGKADTTYSASEMSDGERVIFYLIGQCLAAPKDGVIIIDEPELHLHKSIQVPLWNELEKYRSDCLFVYISHDVDFSASKESSVKIWLKSFDGSQWEWEEVEQTRDMPEELLLEVIGSRKPVVFVEGENGSYDVALYRAILKGFLVIPVGSCSKVIQTVKSLKDNKQLHRLEIYGLIDRDRRVDAELAALEDSNVYSLSVAEVESLFCTEEVIRMVSTKLEKNAADVINDAKTLIFNSLKSELEAQISLKCISEVKFKLNIIDEKAKGAAAIQSALDTLTNSIDISSIYNEAELAINNAINSEDYNAVLRIYNRKSLASQLGGILGFKKDEFPSYVVRLAKGASANEIVSALKPYFGNFSRHFT